VISNVRIRRRSPAVGAAPHPDEVPVFAAVSALLGYPDADLIELLPSAAALAGGLGPPAGERLGRFVEELQRTGAVGAATEYVRTFDLARRCCLYLTYYTFGDTRRRGMALVSFNNAYRSAGFVPPVDELPDHLAVVCNFAACAPDSGRALLVEHQAGVEALRLALADARSPYLSVIDALCSVLPPPAERDVARALELAREGPPAETVGLEPFAPPEYMGGARS
jgi:nitrate reductase delta subunit